MGKFFSVQDVINSETIKINMSKIYGGNITTENGIHSVVNMFLEAGLFTRPKQGIYVFKSILNFGTEIAKKFSLNFIIPSILNLI